PRRAPAGRTTTRSTAGERKRGAPVSTQSAPPSADLSLRVAVIASPREVSNARAGFRFVHEPGISSRSARDLRPRAYGSSVPVAREPLRPEQQHRAEAEGADRDEMREGEPVAEHAFAAGQIE